MKKLIITISIISFALAINSQSYKIDLFEKQNQVQLDIWTYGAWQPTDRTHITASISKFDTVYIFRIKSIKSNQIILWSEKQIIKSAFPFQINTANEIKIIESDKYYQMMNDLRNDVKKSMRMTDKDLEDMEGYQNFLISPRVMYEAYHQPYIEILKHFISKQIKNQTVEVWEPNFSDSIPAKLITKCSLKKEKLITNHTLQQDEKTVCNYLFDKAIEAYKSEGKDTDWYAETFSRDKCPFMHTEYKFDTEFVKNRESYIPIRIKYERKEPISVEIIITIKE